MLFSEGKKEEISSAIFLAALLVFINCKNNAGDAVGKGNDEKDSVKTFYESIIKLGNGFIDVFNAFSGLVADTFFKSDPKKSDLKTYFESISNTLTATKSKLDELGSSSKKGENGGGNDNGKASVKSAVDEVSAWLGEMIKAAADAAKVGEGGDGKIGDADNNGAQADAGSVKGIAKGIKGIVDAAGKALGEGDALKDVKEADGDGDKEAGKLFGTQAGGGNADDIAKAAAAVSAVSGEQILKAIVAAAAGGDQAGAAAGAAKNPIAAAIGAADAEGAEFGNDMKKNDKIAAAIVLRGVAKSGKFAGGGGGGKQESVKSAVDGVSAWLGEMIKAAADAAKVGEGGDDKIGDADNNGVQADANSVKGIAKGIKGIVDAAGKALGEGDALKDVIAAGDGDAGAGKLFGTGGGNAGDIAKAAAAVSAVSGEQILKAIVAAAAGEDQEGKAAGEAKNPIAAAIGAAGAGAEFGQADMKKNDKIAAAIVLRGVAKSGKFAGGGNANAGDIAKAAAAVSAVSGEQILKAIVAAAAGEDQAGKAAGEAKNPIAAAIGNGAAAEFGDDMKKNDKIAAAIVLRGVAKSGKFAGGGNGNGKASVKSAVDEVSAWLGEMIKAAADAAKVGEGGGDKIGDAADNGTQADAGSVNGIAKGIKGIVDAAGKALGEGDALKDVIAAGDDDANKEAGKLFGTQAGGNADAGDIAKAAAAVSAVSGEQILKAIVAAAAGGDQAGKAAGAAKNPIAAAIGAAGAAAAFGDDMKKNDKIAAAIVLRGVAKSGKFAGGGNDNDKASVKSAVDEVSAWLGEMIKAAADAAKVGEGGGDKIGDADNNGVQADANSVKGIAKGIKGIVDAAGKALGEGDALKDVIAAGDGGAGAGKLFGTGGAGGNAGAGDIAKAAAAVSAVSGEQILKAIVAAAAGGDQEGAAAGAAKNPIAAAIGAADAEGAEFGNDMKKNDKIAAAIVLRGVAKSGKFAVAAGDGKQESVKSAVDEVSAWLGEMIKAAADAAKVGEGGDGDKIGDADNNGAQADANSVKGIAKGIKGIVDAAGKALGEGDALKDVIAAGDGGNKEAGKLFGTQAGANAGADDIAKAAAAVSAVSGEQILKAIVAAAAGGDQEGKAAGDAKNPIAAAIGAAGAQGAEFGQADMKKNDKIAAAIVLRGVAKSGKFAVDGGGNANDKASVKSAVDEVSAWLGEMIKAAADAAKVGEGGGDKIGDAADNGAQADAGSVKGIAKGIKGIVDAAGKALGEGNALKDVKEAAGDGNANKEAGKLFGTRAGANADDIAKAAAAVSAVSGEQILKAIVAAAAGEDQAGAAAADAKNPIAAAIGNGAGAAFGQADMKKNDKIAAAIVLRGVAKSGKFAVAGGGKQESVKSAVDEVSAWLGEMIKAAADAAKVGEGGDGKIGDADNNGAQADASSVNGIAKGIKGIVDAAGKALGEGDALKDVKEADGDGDGNKEAGKLFGTQAGANADDIAKAAAAVSAVSGEQILKAIVAAAAGEDQAGAAAGAAKNPIAAAIGNGAAAEFGQADMKKNDKIAAAIVLRGVAKSGKFAVAAGNDNGKASVKSAVESAVQKTFAALTGVVRKAAEAGLKKVAEGGGGDKIGDADNNGAQADASSVKGIAKGIKGIVDAAGKALGEGDALKDVKEAAGDGDAGAGKLFGTRAGGNGNAGDIAKAAAGAAKNPIAAAIGNGAAAEFGQADMKKNDKIAAAIVLRGGG
ncbi:variable large family protein [Borreliella garinii]|uniref:variable large family protein n=1 Tax=Borreliella garinii TaxID=29519 RepID=UPI0039828251